MLKIKSVSMRNFLSVGNAPQHVDLDRDGMTLILGQNMDVGGANSRNGVGKSTILQAVSFGLYGQSISNIKRDNLVNSTNGKNMVVTVEFECNSKRYRVERGRKPAFTRFFVDDGLVNTPETDEGQGDSKNTQDEIDKILGLTHTMFKHIVALNTYTDPFLKMKPGDQRIVIEELMGITQISTRSEVLKEQIKDTKDSIRDEEARIKAKAEANAKIQQHINELNNKSSNWITMHQHKIKMATESLAEISELDIEQEVTNHHRLQDFNVLTSELATAAATLRRYENDLVNRHMAYERATSSLASIVANKCYECGQDIAHSNTHKNMTDRLTAEQKQIESDMRNLADEIAALQQTVSELTAGLELIGEKPQTVYGTLQEALEHRNTVKNLQEAIEREQKEVNPYLDQIDSLSTTGIQVISHEALNDLHDLLKHQDLVYKLLTSKDSFIRKKIIDQNISLLNHRLNFYLEKLQLPHEVRFMSDLSVEISLLGRDFDFEQLSRGEMNRVILSTSWAFRDIWESLNQGINLMFVDEMLDSGTDAQGVESALEVLKKMGRERNKHVFLITHREELLGRVEQVLKVVKENGFTKILIDEDKV